jgi:hypothetical protein
LQPFPTLSADATGPIGLEQDLCGDCTVDRHSCHNREAYSQRSETRNW